ncbi:MAG: hypothetical protein ACSLEM_03115 [Candidatus Malihini olakiniferum]
MMLLIKTEALLVIIRLNDRMPVLSTPSAPYHYAVRIKKLISLPSSQIEDSFNLVPGEGALWLHRGFLPVRLPAIRLMGSGFLYTNKYSIKLPAPQSILLISVPKKTHMALAEILSY